MDGVNHQQEAPAGAGQAAGPRRYSDLQGIARALAILETLAEQPLRAKELADALDLKWTTAYRALTHLRETGYVRKDEATGLYAVGSRLYSLGTSYVAHHPMVPVARPILRAAADEAHATAQLVERDRHRSIVLAVAEPASETIPRATAGHHFPLHCGSKGHLLLACADEATIDEYLARPLEQLTRHTVVDPTALRALLDEIRAQGYAVTRRDVQLSTGSLAAPVHDGSGAVVACVCLITSASQLDEREETLLEVVLDAARSISTALGWRPALGARVDP
ncbi:MAG: IclR family transcriptional regulator [Thermoleophilia bacterium]